MTKAQFKQALLRGQGRCILAAQKDPDRYFPIVMWACSHTVSFDTQCEGSRAWFVYQLICCYQDRTPFLNMLTERLQKAKSDGSWKIFYLAEVLSHFALNGDKTAEQALWEKYQELYDLLINRRRAPNRYFAERDDFSNLCKLLVDSRLGMLKIAEDVGRLYCTRSFYDAYDFEWLFFSKAKQYMRTLKKHAHKSENIAEFIRAGEAREMEAEIKTHPPERIKTGRGLSVWLNRKASTEEVLKCANDYLAQTDPTERAEALRAFCVCPYPGDPGPIIEDAKSSCEELRDAAWETLEKLRHPDVRLLALEQQHINTEKALPVLIVNYQEGDEKALEQLVRSIPVDFECTTIWHGVHLDILQMEDYSIKAPSSLLYYIFESTYCSCCRYNAVRQLGKRRLLTNGILEECVLDSNYDIRSYAKSLLARRNRV